MSKRFNSLMAIAFAALLAWPTGAFAQKVPFALRSSRVAKQDPRAAEQLQGKINLRQAMPLTKMKSEKSIGTRKLQGRVAVLPGAAKAPVALAGANNPLMAVEGTEFWVNQVYYPGMDAESPTYMSKVYSSDFSKFTNFIEGPSFSNGVGYSDGVIYGASLDLSYLDWGFVFTDLYSYSAETGEELSYEYTYDGTLASASDVAVTREGLTYGFFYNAELSGIDFAVVDYATKSRTAIAPAEKYDFLALGITKDGVIYGIDTACDLYKIDAATGVQTKIGNTGVTGIVDADGGYYGQTGEIDQRTGVFYWLALDRNAQTAVYAVDLTTGAATPVYNYPETYQLYALMNAPYVEPTKAPAKPTNFDVTFDGLHSYLHFDAPTTTASGEDLPEKQSLGYVVLSNGEEVTRGTCFAGETKSTVIELPDGVQNVQVYCENAWGQSPSATKALWIGRDIPVAVETVTAAFDEATSTVNVTWPAVSEGAHDGDVLDVVYDVYRIKGDTVLVAGDIAATEYSEEVEIGKLTPYSYAVAAKNKAGESEKTFSNVIVIGNPLEVPYFTDFKNPSDLGLFTIIDANEDGKTWGLDTDSRVSCSYNTDLPMDDWLILPPVALEGGKNYGLLVKALIRSNSYPERFEVKMGKEATVEAMTTELIGATDALSQDEPTEASTEFSVEETGVYYIGIHGISDANAWRLYIESIALEAGPTPGSPAKIDDLAVAPAEDGALKAEVTMTAPKLSMSGDELTENLTKIDLYRDNNIIFTFEDVAPGAALNYMDEAEDLTTGTHVYQAIAYNAEGNGAKSDKVSVYIGQDIPADIEDFACKDQQTSVKMTWTPVGTVGANGGVVKPDEVEYQVWSLAQGFFGLTYNEQLASVKGVGEYELAMNTLEGEQDYAYFSLQTVNEAGKGASNVDAVFVGAPYQLPFYEPVSSEGLNSVLVYSASEDVNASLGENASNGDGSCIASTASEPEAYAQFAVGKVDVSTASNPVQMVDVDAPVGATVKFVIEKQDGTEVEGEAVNVEEAGYKTYSVSLADFTDQAFVVPYIRIDYPETAGTAYIDNFQIIDQLEYNLDVAISAPTSVSAGADAAVSIDVTNMGEKEAKGYTVKLTADGEAIELDQTEFPNIAPTGVVTFTATYSPTIFDKGGNVVLKAEAVYDLDLNDKNNVAETTIKVNMPSVAGPENVAISGNEVSWTAPSNTVGEMTESFEDFDLYDIGGVTYGNPAGKIGDWSVYDEDGAMYTYGFSGGSGIVQYPGAGEAIAWQVFDGSEIFSDGLSLARTGNRLMISTCAAQQDDNTQGAPDTKDWLISPVLPGVAQTVKFFVRQASSVDPSSSSYYGYEGYELYYSTTDTNIASFTKVAEGKVESAEWAEVTFDIPEGAKYFAIRHVAHDVFMLYVDDVTFTTGTGDIVGYNIYVDGEQVGSVEGSVLSFVINGLSGEHQIAVTAVYANGIESLPVYVSSSAKGLNDVTAIDAIIATGKPFDVYTVNGVQVRQQTRSIDGLQPGVYVVNGLKVMIK
ncbi:MAG: choice-of-anchor J domain-containing protein [Prevotella sp.]|nr:choice-of-anchor J domain-containing protein [Prevotella sp.]